MRGREPGLGRKRQSDGFIRIFCDEGTGEARQMSSKSQTAKIYIPVPAWTLLFFIIHVVLIWMWTGLLSLLFKVKCLQPQQNHNKVQTDPVSLCQS